MTSTTLFGYVLTSTLTDSGEDDYDSGDRGYARQTEADAAGRAHAERNPQGSYQVVLSVYSYQGEGPEDVLEAIHPHVIHAVILRKADPRAIAREEREYRAMCQSEGRMQAGMAFGVQGWNDY